MANNPTDESTPEELDAEAIQEGADADQTQSGAEDEADDERQDAHDDDRKVQGDAAEELAKVKDQLLRTVAEMENVRRRAQRDVENAHKFAVEKLLGELLPVVDSLEKAEELAKTTDNADSMAEGISLSLKLFVSTLEKSGIALVDPLGEPFDPQLHEAMAMVPNPDAEPNSVIDVMQRGYTLNGRLVRAAKVVVVKGEQ
jgi:molecular chaperone GrpE